MHGTSGPTSGLEVPSASNHHVPISDVDEHKPPELSSYFVDPTAAYERKSNWRSNLYASAGVVINVLKESSDACTPLKSVAGGLSTILTYYDVRRIYFLKTITLPSNQQTVANRGSIESLIPRIEGLAESLTEPVPDGEVKEINRREALKQ